MFANDGFVIDFSGGGDFSKDHNHVVLGGGFAGDLGERIGLQAGIEDGIGNLIGELVGVTLVDGFRREKEVSLFGGDLSCHFDVVVGLKKIGLRTVVSQTMTLSKRASK